MGGRILLAVLALAGVALAQADVADIPSERVKVGKNDKQVYFRIGPKPKAKKTKKGFGLLIIMPGGGGGEGFHAFCKRLYKNTVDDSYVAVQPVAFKWTERQPTVWPTEHSKVPKQKFSTEEFVEDVVADAREWQKIDPKRIFVLAWSSSGPAAYAISLQKKKSVTGFLIAMSVFRTQWLGSLKEAKGEAYFIYHSKGDKTCDFKLAKDAQKQLGKRGAKVEFLEYQGGHGWGHANFYGNLRAGFVWLEKNHSKPAKAKKPGK